MARDTWFETVAFAQQRAKKRLPKSVYSALLAASEKGVTVADNVDAFGELGFAPHVIGAVEKRDVSTTVMGQEISLPVVISPTGVQAVHPDGEVAVARAAAARGDGDGFVVVREQTGRRCRRCQPEDVLPGVLAGRQGRYRRAGRTGAGCRCRRPDRDHRLEFRARPRLGQPEDPRAHGPAHDGADAPGGPHPAAMVPAMGQDDAAAESASAQPGSARGAWTAVLRRVRRVDGNASAHLGGHRLAAGAGGGPFMLKGVMRVDDAKRAVDEGVSAISVSNHGGNNLDGTPASIRALAPIAEAVGDQIEVLLDGGIRRGSDVVKALALGARAVMIGRAYLWGLAAEGQAGVENVLDVLNGEINSAMMGLGRASIHDLVAGDVVVPRDFIRALGVPPQPST